MMSAGIVNKPVVCSNVEILRVTPPHNTSCAAYLGAYQNYTGATITGMDADGACGICPLGSTNSYLESIGSRYEQRWRNLGIFVAFICFNVAGTFLLYWLARVPKRKKIKSR